MSQYHHDALSGKAAYALLLAALLGLQPATAATAQQQGPRSLTALRIEEQDEPVVVDGVLDDEVWQRAERATGFLQREPYEGQTATERTEFQIAFTADVLYIAIRAWDSQMPAIVSKEMERDADLFRDDSVVILLDTFHDRRNAYVFESNANGARRDVLIADEARDLNLQWDGVWSSRSSRDDDGWTVEMAIPFSTLRFDPQLDTWGLNVRRMIRHKNEEVYWSFIGRGVGSPRDQANYPLYRVSLAGELTGLEGIKPSKQLGIKPFAVMGGQEDVRAGDIDDEAEVGLDIKWGITRSLNLDLTYNTDFAEVEVDQQQINLTRFSLFFPEKREFFLENSGIFEFGLPDRDSFEPTLMKVFFSRRIGLDDGREVPIVAGARLTGRMGGWNLGVLDVLTDEQSFDDGTFVAATNFTVLRGKRNLGERSGLGFIITNRDDSGGDSNLVYGLDLDWKPTPHWDFSVFAAQSDDRLAEEQVLRSGDGPQADSLAVDGKETADEKNDDWTAGYAFGYQRGDLRASFEHSRVNQRFNPATGFLLRDDFERLNPRIQWRPRVNRWGMRSWFLEANYDRFDRASIGNLESSTTVLSPIGWRSVREDGWALSYVSETEQLFEPFEIHPGIIIPVGRYEFDGWRIGGRTNQSRLLSLSGRVQGGDFYEGERTAANISLDLRVSKLFRAQTNWGLADVSLPQGAFTTNIYGQRLSFSFSPNVRINAFVQFNDDQELIASNIRFNWIYRPGSDIFVVFNQTWDAPTFGSRDITDRQLIVKFTYLFRL